MRNVTFEIRTAVDEYAGTVSVFGGESMAIDAYSRESFVTVDQAEALQAILQAAFDAIIGKRCRVCGDRVDEHDVDYDHPAA